MLTVSEAYKAAINASARNVTCLVALDFANNWDLPFASVTASSTHAGYLAAQACDGRIKVSEGGYVGNDVPSFLNTPKVGWKGTAVATDGVLASAETLTIIYNESVKTKNFWVLADEDNYPTDFSIEVRVGGSWQTIATVVGNTSFEYYLRTASAYQLDAVRVTISKVNLGSEHAFVLEAGAITTVIFEDKDLVSVDLLEEAEADGDRPIGNISANECTCVLLNTNRRFLPSNQAGPFFGILRPALRLRPFMGVEISDNTFEMVPLGIFYGEDWSCKSNSMKFPLRGLDEMAELCERDTPTMRGIIDTNLGVLTGLLLDKLGFDSSKRVISSELDSIGVTFGFFPNDVVREAFRQLCNAGLVVICVNRAGKIAIRPINTTGTPVTTWHVSQQIFDVDNPQQFNDIFSKVNVKYYTPSALAEEELLSLGDLEIPNGTTTFGPYNFYDAPIAAVTSIQISPMYSDVTLAAMCGTNELSLVTVNSDATVTVAVSVMGKRMALAQSSRVYTNEEMFGIVDRTTTVDCTLIQNESAASAVGSDFLNFVSDPSSNVTLMLRGDPAVELLDVVTVVDDAHGIGTIGLLINKTSLSWDGSLSATVSGRKVSLP